ncbi:hypothetical protein QYM36_014199, partial [Artemia franciscana]
MFSHKDLTRIEIQNRKNEPLPEGWAIDKSGKVTTDGRVAMQEGCLLPLGGTEINSGYKGYGLAFMVELFCGILSGSDYGPKIRRWLEADRPANLGQCFIAVDPNCFAPGFSDRLQDMMDFCRNMEPTESSKPVLVAGDPEKMHMDKVNRQGGITYLQNQIDASTQLRLKMLANATRSRTELYLIGSSVSELRGSNLPSLRMALGFFLHLHLELNETIRHSSAAAVTELAKFWRKARIPMRDHQNCQTKLEQAFEEWRLLKKNKVRKSSTQQAREAAFVSRLEDLFDIAHADALNTMSIQEDKDFLLAQREKGRRGSMVGVDETLACKEKRVAKHRIHSSASIRAKFQSYVPLVVHWDGKLIPDLIEKEKVDRLPVLVSGKEVLQLLTVAKLPSGTGEAQASAVFGAIEDWGIPGNIRAMCFDTTSSNTGRISGACVLLEQKLGKELLSLACRHHIMELVIGAAFRVCMGSTSSPEVPLFKRFQDYWRFIDTDKYETGIAADDVARLVDDIKQSTIDFANKHLEQSQPRDDYKEFLELVLIFLHLQITCERSTIHVTRSDAPCQMDEQIRVYLKAWISAPLASGAPYSDLLLLKSLLEYSSIHLAISKATSNKFSDHLWYLSPELVGLAFFDSRVSSSTKRLM